MSTIIGSVLLACQYYWPVSTTGLSVLLPYKGGFSGRGPAWYGGGEV